MSIQTVSSKVKPKYAHVLLQPVPQFTRRVCPEVVEGKVQMRQVQIGLHLRVQPVHDSVSGRAKTLAVSVRRSAHRSK